MKILMFGRGVIASIYGRALEEAGHTVEFYVRPGRASQYGPTLELEVLDARHTRPYGVTARLGGCGPGPHSQDSWVTE